MSKSQAIATLFALITAMPALGGDVTVRYSNGDVRIYGDARDNQIEIRHVALSFHEFKGVQGTTLNGSTRSLILPIYDSLSISMAGGNDSVKISSLNLSGSLANLDVDLGAGNDTFQLNDGRVRQGIYVGFQTKTPVWTDEDNDSIELNGTDASYVKILTQDRSKLSIRNNDIDRLHVDTGSRGGDTITAVSNKFRRLWMHTSGENDRILFFGNRIVELGEIQLAGGNDDLQMWQESFHFAASGYMIIRGGSGSDDLLRYGRGPVYASGFEN